MIHLVVGPDQHGVVRHAASIAAACRQRLVRVVDAADVRAVPPADVVHMPFTDRLFGRDAEAALDSFTRIAALVRAAGARVSVTLHDIPPDDSPLQQRRRAVYDAVCRQADGVVVNSRRELALIEDRVENVHSLRMIPLPIEAPRPVVDVALPPRSVVVLGFVFPDRGYEDVVAALPSDARLVAVGRPADGHADLIGRYRALSGGRFESTGFVPDEQLPGYLAAAAVPVAPNRRVTASASINTWLAHGRRPLVPDSPYAREILAARPDALTIYDPADPADLAGHLAAALERPELTRAEPSAPDLDAVAACYRAHLEACRPPRPAPTARGAVVPGNRWDLLPVPSDAPTVSVVIPYFDAQPQLDRVLAALDGQPTLEVVVVDDGSPRPPDLPPRIRLLRQDNRGFRAAAARNLGAAAAAGDVLVFLDGDTAPEPDFVARLAARAASGADVVAVGRRRHRDPDTGAELAEPEWLRSAYADSANLLRADRRSYRFVISAVLGLRRELFDRIGGFDERFVEYGGEDWEFAHRAWNAGAVLVHEPAAVAWHDGPSWAERGDQAARARAKNAETAMLARLLPDPDARGPGAGWAYPSIVVLAPELDEADAVATARSALAAGVDCAFWFAPDVPPADVLARAWCQVRLHGPCDLSELAAIADQAARHGSVHTPALTAVSTRAAARARRHDLDAAWLFGRHDRSGPVLRPVTDLAAQLAGRS